VGVIECPPYAEEVRQQEIPVEQAVDPFIPGGLLERPDGVARGDEQRSPPTTPHDLRGGLGPVALGTHGQVERRLGVATRRRTDLAAHCITSGTSAPIDTTASPSAAIASATSPGARCRPGSRHWNHHAARCGDPRTRAGCAPQLTVAEFSFEPDGQPRVARATVLDGNRVYQASGVGVPAVRGEDGRPHHQFANC
jgi:hypothetical protein